MIENIRRITRIEVPLDVGSWATDLVNAEMIADEYNRLVKYLNEREEALGLASLSGARHGGFVMAAVIVSMAMDIVDKAPQGIAANVMVTAQALSSLSNPTSIKEKNEQ